MSRLRVRHSEGTEWIRRHKRSLLGSVGGGTGLLVALWGGGQDYIKLREQVAANAQHDVEIDRKITEMNEKRSVQWQAISSLQRDVESLKATKKDKF